MKTSDLTGAELGKSLILYINDDKINSLGTRKILDALQLKVMPCNITHGVAWLIAIQMPNGQKVAAYPGSSINHLAPPYFYITDPECTRGVYNKEIPSLITRRLKKFCDDPLLYNAVKILKMAVNAISE